MNNKFLPKYKFFHETTENWDSRPLIERQIFDFLERHQAATAKQIQAHCLKPPNRIETWKDGRKHPVWRDRKGRWAKRHYSLKTIRRHLKRLIHQDRITWWPWEEIHNPKGVYIKIVYTPSINVIISYHDTNTPAALFGLLAHPLSYEEYLILLRAYERGYVTHEWVSYAFDCSPATAKRKTLRLRRSGILKPFSWNTEYHENCPRQAWYINPDFWNDVLQGIAYYYYIVIPSGWDKISQYRKIQDKN